jgi:hypothetical protein
MQCWQASGFEPAPAQGAACTTPGAVATTENGAKATMAAAAIPNAFICDLSGTALPLPETVSHFLSSDLAPTMLPASRVLSWARQQALAHQRRLPHFFRPCRSRISRSEQLVCPVRQAGVVGSIPLGRT